MFPLAPIPLKVQTRCKPPPPLMWAGSVYTSTRANKRQTLRDRERQAGRRPGWGVGGGNPEVGRPGSSVRVPSLSLPCLGGQCTPGGRIRTAHPFANRMQGDAYRALWAKFHTRTYASRPCSLSTPRPGLELSQIPGAADRDMDMHLLTSDHLFECIHYPENCMPAQCSSACPFTQRSQKGREHTIPTFA